MKREKMDPLEKRRKELARAQEEFRALERASNLAKLYPTVRLLEGRYQKYSNSYSGGQDRWWVYRHIKEIKPNGEAIIQQFQMTPIGRIEIEPEKIESWLHTNLSGQWLSSDKKEYDEAFEGMLATIKKMGKAPE